MTNTTMNLEQQKIYNKVLKKIEACRKKGGEILDLSNLYLSHLPPEIGQLTSLSELILEGNVLNTLPPEIGQLTALRVLRLDGNDLRFLPREIGNLIGLEELNLSYNELTSFPVQICQLTALKALFLTHNLLSSLPSEIGQLKALTRLDLDKNILTTLPPEIGQLKELEIFFLTDNRLSCLPLEFAQLQNLGMLILDFNQLDTLPLEICQLSRLIHLDLSDNQITSVPSEICQLTLLRVLHLANNQLRTLSPGVCQLFNLTHLNLINNKLRILPSGIGLLTELTSLELANNQLSTLPKSIGQLTLLERVDLSSNILSQFPESFGHLGALKHLNLADNRFSTLQMEIGKLSALTILDLTGNQFSSLPDWLKLLSNLEHIFLHNNPALNLSPTVLGAGWGQTKGWVSAKSILDFYFGTHAGKTRALNEVKLIMVGRGGAGKTSTVQALQGLPFNNNQTSTPGIALCDWVMDGCKKAPVTAHVWDFAGQVITHSLHQFFFSVRSVYVVVLTGRENNERDDAEYWLRLIKAFGTDEQGNGPPVVVALNKWDLPGCRPKVDRGALQERYPFIREFVEIDCQTKKGISKLKTALCKEVDRLQWVREPFPESWDSVRRALTSGRKKRAHLSYTDYRKLCTEHGVSDERQQDSLAEVLHHLGAALNYRNDPRLREATVLQPEWLTKNVYGLVRRAEKKAGVLTHADVDAVLRSEKDPAMRAYLVQIMERFEIAYAPRATDENGGVWLVPQALPDQQPKSVTTFLDPVDATRLRYIYQALPEGLVARAIVRLHEFIEEVNGEKQQWATGVILSRDGARALIRTETQDRQVMITVTGPTKARQQLAGLCQAEMRDIHAEIRGLNPIEETQVYETWMATATLEADERKKQQTGIPTKNQGTVMVDPTKPNNEYSEKLARTNDVWKPTVFISYSKCDVNQRKRLESELKMLMNEGLLSGLWHDRMIDPGDEWDNTIQKELTEADIVIILASSAALSTDYITTHEIPKAMELHNDDKVIVVPIILEACRWHKTILGTLNALPEKGKALNKWKPSSDGWLSIADGLARVCEKLMKNGGAKMTKQIKEGTHQR